MAESSPTSLRRAGSMSQPPRLSSSSVSLSEELQCCICLDVFSDPVSTSCGHNFCRICLKQYWDNSQIYSCPYCKETFSKRPELKINTTLRDLTLIFKEKSSQVKSDKISLRRSDLIVCDVCDERKLKALKSCLMCQMSYCKTHLEPHKRVLNLKKHKLIEPVENIKDYICVKHERPLELFCRDDQTCVCVFCTDGDHKNHNTVPLEEESKEKKVRVHNNI
ncbi:E3 ubiquitin/ISG15 ligase TRIM25-like [Misgurnus anguillicaudatus]|uniref:E3 ubiquitin/ISG15 ligase TRIM25-like n=1 Tax=Misgurnus anguillicaudatus TaxID=75329 RepID=UPI003CCFCE33